MFLGFVEQVELEEVSVALAPATPLSSTPTA